MSPTDNPFARGYQNLHYTRMLLITRADDRPPLWRPLHPTQSHLTDDRIARFPCLIAEDFALVIKSREVPPALGKLCYTAGIVQAVVYTITGRDCNGSTAHIGDTCSEEAAREVVRRLSFETGFYSRCWEISMAHLPVESRDYLADLAHRDARPAWFEVFHLPISLAIGVKLIGTPWTDHNLAALDGTCAEALRQEHREQGIPDALADVLHLAAQADVRMLVFDADAPVLDGLPCYDDN